MNNEGKQFIAKIIKEVVNDVMDEIKKENMNQVSTNQSNQLANMNKDYFNYNEFMSAKEEDRLGELLDIRKFYSTLESWDSRGGVMFGAEFRPLVDDNHMVRIPYSCGIAMADDGFVAIKRDGTVEPIAREYPMIIGGCRPTGVYVPFGVNREGYQSVQEMFSAPFENFEGLDD